MLLPYAIIFVTGGATLAMELIASRVMTPYFGVSLYIWTGILPITLVALALGYWLGGRLANSMARSGKIDQLRAAYLMMPAISAIALVVVCLIYPHMLPLLANYGLVIGAFAACVLLLDIPLVSTSAMNPLLIAILAKAKAGTDRAADAGAG